MDNFTPVYKLNGMKTKQEAFEKIFSTLKDDEKTIIGRGTSDSVLVSVGSRGLILKDDKSRKKNKGVGKRS